MKKHSKILALILCAILIVGVIAIAVSAAEDGPVAKIGEVEYASITEALDAAVAGDTIVLTNDAEISAPYNVFKDITIDLNGKTLTSTSAEAFIVNSAATVEIKGEGNIVLEGRLVTNTATENAYTLNVTGAGKGMNIYHTGNMSPNIVNTKTGKVNFTNVEIVSDYQGSSKFDAFFFNPQAGSYDVNFVFDKVVFYNDKAPKAQNANTFLFLSGDNAHASILNSSIRTGGTILYVGYTTATSIDTEIVKVENSHLQIASQDNDNRSCLVWGHEEKGSEKDLYGTINFKDSYIGGNAYRAFHFSKTSENNFKFRLVFDNSTVAHNGANDTNGTNERDSIITRGVLVWLKNGSKLSACANKSNGDGLIMDAAIWAEEGTRFSQGWSTKMITWVDSTGAPRSDLKVVIDPIGDYYRPYVATTDESVAIDDFGAAAFDFYGMEFAAARKSASEYGYYVNNKGNEGVQLEHSDAYQGQPKSGAITKVTYGDNTAWKYWVTPVLKDNTNTYKMGDKVKFGSSDCDSYFIFGDNADYSNAFAPIADDSSKNYKRTYVAVYDMDIATDSEYGFTAFSMELGARKNDNGAATSGGFINVSNDGTITNGKLTDFNSNIKLDTKAWNHITFVVYTDKTLTAQGQLFVYINGELLGRYDTAFGAAAAYLQGIRFNHSNGSTQIVGTSLLVDNFMRRAYTSYAAEGEADGAEKNPSAYLLKDLPTNTTPLCGSITVVGNPYNTLDQAIAAANELGVNVELKGDVTVPQTVTKNGTVIANGYGIVISNDSYGADTVYGADGNFEKFVFDETYTKTVTYKWYVGEKDNDDQIFDNNYYIFTEVKMGQIPTVEFEFDQIYDIENKTMYKQIGWNTTGDPNEVQEFAPLTKSFVENTTDAVNVYPVYHVVSMSFYVKNAEGAVVKAGSTNEETNAAYKGLKDGETIVLCADFDLTSGSVRFADASRDSLHGVELDNDYTEEEIEQMKSVAQVIGFDLNGYKMTLYVGGNIVQVADNTIFNFYSSKPGAEVYSRFLDGKTIKAQRMFSLYNGNGENADNGLTVNNAHINVGKFGEIPGENLILNGGVLYEGITGDSSCFINVDGVLGMRGTPDSAAAIMTRAYWGNIIVKNSVILAPTSGYVIDLKDTYKTSDGAIASPYVYIENTLLVNNCGFESNIVSANGGLDKITLEYKNVIATGRFNPSNIANVRVRVNEGVGGSNYKIGTVNAPESIVIAKYNKPIDLSSYIPENYIYAVQTPVYDAEAGAINYDVYTYVVTQGYESLVPEGANYVVLGDIVDITAYADDAVNVNFNDANGNLIEARKYIEGGNVLASDFTAPEILMNATKFVGTGWTGEVTNVKEGSTVVATYEAKSNIAGVKANLALYSDFNVNLYIPASYAEYITSVTVNDSVLAKEAVTINGKDYVKVFVTVNPDEATDDVKFVINVTEGENTVACSVTVSVASYAEQVLADAEKYTAEDKSVVYSVVKYAYEADKYFGGEVNTVLSALLTTYESAKVDEANTYENAIAELTLSGAFDYVTVSLAGAPAYVLTVKEGFAGTVKVAYGEIERVYTLTADDDRVIVISGMKAYNFVANINITADGVIGETAVNVNGAYNLDTFVKYHVENAAKVLGEDATEEEKASVENSKACLDVLVSFYDYVEAADAYANRVVDNGTVEGGTEEGGAEEGGAEE